MNIVIARVVLSRFTIILLEIRVGDVAALYHRRDMRRWRTSRLALRYASTLQRAETPDTITSAAPATKAGV
jgi:hypothetical protein